MFKQYKRSAIAEMREVTADEAKMTYIEFMSKNPRVSISISDKEEGSPKFGDMIARNPKNYEDQWLVAADYFKDNFEEIK